MNAAVEVLKDELARLQHRLRNAALAYVSEQNGLYLTESAIANLRARAFDIEQALVTLEFGP